MKASGTHFWLTTAQVCLSYVIDGHTNFLASWLKAFEKYIKKYINIRYPNHILADHSPWCFLGHP